MIPLKLHMEGDRCWPDLTDKRELGNLIDLMNVPGALELAALPRGTQGGKTTITLRLNLPDGQVVLAQTTLALLEAAVRAFRARYPDEPQ